MTQSAPPTNVLEEIILGLDFMRNKAQASQSSQLIGGKSTSEDVVAVDFSLR